MKTCIDKRIPNDNLFGLYNSYRERETNLLGDHYQRIIGADTITEQTLIDSKVKGDFGRLLSAGSDSRQKLQELAIYRDKKWANGKTIRVKFLNGTQFLRDKVKDIAIVWSRFANLNFEFVTGDSAEIKISFQHGNGSWSYIGVDCLSITDPNEPTMNFGWFDANTPDSEFQRTILHEFGHALGCIHEHQSPSANIPWDKPSVYNYYASSQGWTKSDVDNNIFMTYDNNTAITNSVFDPKSIMLYPIDGSLTSNQYVVEMNSEISVKDALNIGKWYPFR